ncbi:phage portal protein [Devosia algicola]|uniref:phage portal protein n=1 Tax=Devosia algicola TaxID=3026418 RepID=UPI002E1C7E76
MLEAVYAYLQTAGNAYLQAGMVDGEVKALYCLRPDRMRVVPGRDGWPAAYAYTAAGRTMQLSQTTEPVPSVLHMALFHPLDDHYGMAPLDAAQTSLDIHNAAGKWNKALLDNAARPSGALVYSVAGGNLSGEQFDRLKAELEQGFAGAANAGRPMVLEGGLDWKTIGLTPRDMDFIEAKNAAARDIALAFGVPPMLLGIPGDNTYANLAEANRALWRQTIIPLVRRVTDDLSNWLAPAFEGTQITADFDGVEALAEDRSAMWARIGAADFLSDDEKRAMLGVENG